MFDEITRILNHLLWLGAHGLDIGAMTVFLYCFREREDLMDAYEAVSGARMHAAYYRPGGVYRDLPDTMPQYQASQDPQRSARSRSSTRTARARCSISSRISRSAFPKYVDDYETLLTENRIWKQRTVGIGVVSPGARAGAGLHRPDAARLGHRMGPAQEAALRGLRPDASSTSRSARTATATTAISCASRRLRQSNRIIKQCIDWLRKNPGPVMVDNHKVAPPARVEMKQNMEELIHHFKLFTEGMHVPAARPMPRSRRRRASSAST